MAVEGITKTTIAQACGVSLPMMIDKLIQSGVITPSMEVGKPGKRSTTTLCRRWVPSSGTIGRPMKRQERRKSQATSAKRRADADYKRYHADIEELKLKELRGEVHRRQSPGKTAAFIFE